MCERERRKVLSIRVAHSPSLLSLCLSPQDRHRSCRLRFSPSTEENPLSLPESLCLWRCPPPSSAGTGAATVAAADAGSGVPNGGLASEGPLVREMFPCARSSVAIALAVDGPPPLPESG